MGANTKIEWAHHTFNPWIGCTKVSAACDHCYAEDWDKRYEGGQHWGAGAPRRLTSAANWRKPLAWNRQAAKADTRPRVFCASLADVFDSEVPDAWRDRLFALIALTPHLDWLLLTKRPQVARKYLSDPDKPRRVDTLKHVILAGRLSEIHAPERMAEAADWPGYFVTSKGRVLSDKTNAGTRGDARHELKPQIGAGGHARVTLYAGDVEQRELVHRLVLDTFDRSARDGEQGCHIDGDPENNALWNLRWGDQSANWEDSKRHGTRRRYSKLTIEDVDQIRQRLAAGESAYAIAPDFGVSDTQIRNIATGRQWQPECHLEWPLKSVWLGTTVETQQMAEVRIPTLLQCPAARRFLSCEPLLGPVQLDDLCDGHKFVDALRGNWWHDAPRGPIERGHPKLDWIIAGGESGPHAQPSHPDWFRSLRDQCQAAGVPFFFKQWGEWSEAQSGDVFDTAKGRAGKPPALIVDPNDGTVHCFLPENEEPDRRYRAMLKVGKKAAGRLLDGREWNEVPDAEEG